jgi:hypothetical protein
MYWTSAICNSHEPWDIANIQPYMISIDDKRVIAKVIQDQVLQDQVLPVHVLQIHDNPIIQVQEKEQVIKKGTLKTVRKCQDPLFWTLFLAKYGETEYIRASKNPNTEMKEKKIVAERFHELGSGKKTSELSIKMTKKGCNRTVEDIVTQPKLLLSSLSAFCHYYKINVYIVDNKKKTYIQFLLDKHEQYENVILYRRQDRNYTEYFVESPSPHSSTQDETITNLKNDFLCLISYDKSLKSVSFYKLSDLNRIYSQLGMTDPPKKKHELYEKIIVHCVWELGK